MAGSHGLTILVTVKWYLKQKYGHGLIEGQVLCTCENKKLSKQQGENIGKIF